MNQQQQLTARQKVISSMSHLADELFQSSQAREYDAVLRETVDYFLRVGAQFHFHKHDIKQKIGVCKRFIEVNPTSASVPDHAALIAEYEAEVGMINDLLEKLSTYAVRLGTNPPIH